MHMHLMYTDPPLSERDNSISRYSEQTENLR